MINTDGKIFKLDTENTSYIFAITDEGHLEHIYYGGRLLEQDYTALRLKNAIAYGSAVEYSPENPGYCLDTMLLEYSGIGKGDFRHTPLEVIMPDGSFVTDFVYDSHTVRDGSYECETLPTAYGDAKTLTVTLKDKKYEDIKLLLNYTVYYDDNVIARSTELVNGSSGEVYLRRLMSFMTDFPTADYDIITLDGGWTKEAHENRRPVSHGVTLTESTTGASSNRHNPGFMIVSRDAGYERGEAYGFNLIYSGNHYSAVERCSFNTMRIMSGINPQGFLWRLKSGERFSAPQAVMTYSSAGINGMSTNMHNFVNEHIVRGEHKNAERPIVINNWEATFFNFNCRKLLALASRAKALGVEMFVLDDGWFGKRNSDKAGLGDWTVNKRKIPGGITSLAKKINKKGMKFGLWFEPECVNEDSDLFRAHPDWAVKVPDRAPSLGRNQLVLDLTREEVRDYIVESVDGILTEANVEYVKWDYNRHISDVYSASLKNQGEFYHRYIMGLYEVLRRIFHEKHPHVLFESCSSGGNRFDLGMLCYSPQIWTSDDTDPIERLKIQSGIYCLYPPSSVSAHVSMAPHQQTLRDTPLSARFNVASFGVLGYELDFDELTPMERKEIKEQIEFYKAHRRTFQYGTLYRTDTVRKNQVSWQIKGEGEIIAGLFQIHTDAAPQRDTLRVPSADPKTPYTVDTKKQYLRIKRFGGLIKHIVPFSIKADGFLVRTVDRHFALTDGVEHYECFGDTLNHGINLEKQYCATGYDPKLRILGDFGSNLYVIKENSASRKEKNNG